jgi:hypothetical protein
MMLTYPAPPEPVKDPRRVPARRAGAIVLEATSIVARLPGSPATASFVHPNLAARVGFDVSSERRAVERTPGSRQNTATLCSLRPCSEPLPPFLLACFPLSVMAQDCSLHNPQDGVHVSITEGLERYGPVWQRERPKGNSRGWCGLPGPIGFLGPAHGLALRERMINCRTEAAWPSATGMLRGRRLISRHPAVAIEEIERCMEQQATALVAAYFGPNSGVCATRWSLT